MKTKRIIAALLLASAAACAAAEANGFRTVKDIPYYPDDVLSQADALKKERKFLQNKIAQLTEDVTLWSNNLGFFASSKNADLLKAQFEKKIESTKEEIKQLEEKLKLLKEAK